MLAATPVTCAASASAASPWPPGTVAERARHAEEQARFGPRKRSWASARSAAPACRVWRVSCRSWLERSRADGWADGRADTVVGPAIGSW